MYHNWLPSNFNYFYHIPPVHDSDWTAPTLAEEKPVFSSHYIVQSGDRFAYPDYCMACETYADAVQALIDNLEISTHSASAIELRKYGYVSLSKRTYFAEYAQVTEC